MQRRVPPTNLVGIAGQLVSNPRAVIDAGAPCAEFFMANNQSFRNSKGEKKEKSCYITVVTWGILAKDCLGRLSQKSAVYVEGELESAPKAQGGKIRVRARTVEFLDKDREEEEDADWTSTVC